MAKVDKKIEIKLIKSPIGYNFKQKRTLEALGLNKLNQSVIKNNNDAISGMIRVVRHLIQTKEI